MKINTVKVVNLIELSFTLSRREAEILATILTRYAGVADCQNIKTVRPEEIEICEGILAAIPDTRNQRTGPGVNTRRGETVGEYLVRYGEKVTQ